MNGLKNILLGTKNGITLFFSDEKKFYKDGPDGYQFYWADLRKEEEIFSRRALGGGGIMVWACFHSQAKSDIVFIDHKITALTIQKCLRLILCHSLGNLVEKTLFFNRIMLSSIRQTVQCMFKSQNFDLFDWPALSPDLNPIENLWGILARSVYEKGLQFNSVEDLKTAISDAWIKIGSETLQTLTNSMKQRLFEPVSRKGRSIDY